MVNATVTQSTALAVNLSSTLLKFYAESSWWSLVLTSLAALIGFDYLSFQWKSRGLKKDTGSSSLPLLGSIVPMVASPAKFWHTMFNKGGETAFSLLGLFCVNLNEASSVRRLLESASDKLILSMHPQAKKIMGDVNIAFMNGQHHKEFRRRVLPLFTDKALATYVELQDNIIREHLTEWNQKMAEAKDGLEMRQLVWNMNTLTSHSVFLGPYLGTTAQRKEFARLYRLVTEAFMAVPIYFPGTALWQGAKARLEVVKTLTECAGKSKEAMRAGKQPVCLLDYWALETVKEIDECKKNGQPAPPHSSDEDLGGAMLDFLFASQDASTASLCWVIYFLHKYPEVRSRVVEEQELVRPNNEPITTDLLAKMTYTRQVMREILRICPPPTMVPHKTYAPYKLNEKTTLPVGTWIFPSTYSANHQGWPDADKFQPERFSADCDQDAKYAKNHFLSFGAGPHMCLGMRYAVNQLTCFMSILASETTYVKRQTPTSDELLYWPTIYPGDGVILDSFRYTGKPGKSLWG